MQRAKYQGCSDEQQTRHAVGPPADDLPRIATCSTTAFSHLVLSIVVVVRAGARFA